MQRLLSPAHLVSAADGVAWLTARGWNTCTFEVSRVPFCRPFESSGLKWEYRISSIWNYNILKIWINLINLNKSK